MEERRRLNDADLMPEQKAAVEARKAERQTPKYREGLERDIAAIRHEFPPRHAAYKERVAALAALRLEREQQG